MSGRAAYDNGRRDGDETDVDCGGGSPSKCEVGKRCGSGADCASNDCQNQYCVNTNPPPPPPVTEVIACSCSVSAGDRDGDCEPDAIEDTNGNGVYDAGDFTDIDTPDTDGDRINDGCEDLDHDGQVATLPRELDPRAADTDLDGVPDGLEDLNKNGRYDVSVGETDGTNRDTDQDGFSDGDEDRNHDGFWNCPDYPDSAPCELNPRTSDTDGDGLNDATELRSTTDARFYASGMAVDGQCNSLPGTADALRFLGKNQGTGIGTGPDGEAFDFSLDDQTCPWNADSDGDGLEDGVEDRSADGVVNSTETDPRRADTDRDGLSDGYEDTNHDGLYDPMSETDATRLDTDGDGISDGVEDSGGCTTSFAGTCLAGPTVSPRVALCDCSNWHANGVNANETDPKSSDTDGDGLKDGVEDQNRNGVCELAIEGAAPTPLDETCGFLMESGGGALVADSDGDLLADGIEDINKNGVLDLGEFDARRADADQDCLRDNDEQFLGTDPNNPDTDADGLPDGLEDAKHLQRNPITQLCEVKSCPSQSYFGVQCVALNALDADTDGDGRSDGPQSILSLSVGEDLNADGCLDANETNPCDGDDVDPPPAVGGAEHKCLASSGCPAESTSTPLACAPSCPALEQTATAFACADGNVRPLQILRSEVNDIALALPARKVRLPGADFPSIQDLFITSELRFKGDSVGFGFVSKDAESAQGTEPIRSVFGAVVSLATIQIGENGACDRVLNRQPFLENAPAGGSLPPLPSGTCTMRYDLIASATPSPSDVAEAAFARVQADLVANGFAIERSQSGVFNPHDDQSGDPSPDAIRVQAASDRYTVTAMAGADPAMVKRVVLSALTGRNALSNDAEVAPGAYALGPSIDMRIEFYRRELRTRRFNDDGTSALVPTAQYGAVVALAPLLSDCSSLSGLARARCRLEAEGGAQVVADLTNGSSLGRFSAKVGSQCELFSPRPAKADFLLVVDDSVSMQDYIRGVSRAAQDVATKLRANKNNLDWRIAMTTSNMGRDPTVDPNFGPDAPQTALLDTFEPAIFGPSGYPSGAFTAAGPTGPVLPISYQHTAFDKDGRPVRCVLGDYDKDHPEQSPYCCDGNTALNDEDWTRQCCSFPATSVPTNAGATLPADGNNAIKVTGSGFSRYSGNDTFRCWDFPRYSQLNETPPYVQTYSPQVADRSRHYLDWLCGDLESHTYAKLYGARGHLWPPGFAGPDDANPRLDGANLLVRNADQLILQMNRPCGYSDYTPRSANGSAFEQPLQALKRAVQRAISQAGAAGRDASATPSRYALRKEAPLFSIILSDEDDYALKYRNSARPAEVASRDMNSLPPAQCVNNGDDGCTLAYCTGLYAGLVNTPSSYDYRIPGANDFKNPRPSGPASSTLDNTRGNFCASPFQWTGTATDVPFGGAANQRMYDGLYEVPANTLIDAAANQSLQPSSSARDWLNPNNANPTVCGDGSGADCLPCVRFLRTKQYVDFFGGKCDLPNTAATIPDTEARRYPVPQLDLGGGADVPLPTGRVYAITRRARLQGGVAGACGSDYPGGDGQSFRDVALATGGKVADICAATRPTGFVDFLDEVVVDAQGLASPYRLRGKPISSTIRVAVVTNQGYMRVMRRSSVSGFDYNPVSNAIAFFTMGVNVGNQLNDEERLADEATRIIVPPSGGVGDYKVYVSYRVWDRPCPSECAVNDVCAVCACSAGSPWCCAPEPARECRPKEPCPQGCGACQKCDPVSNECRDLDPCNNACGSGQQCNYQSGQCESCPAGSVAVPLACGEGCTTPTRFVCITQSGNGTGACVSDGHTGSGTNDMDLNDGDDCCGSDRACAANQVCILVPCAGESCFPKARCHETSGDPSQNNDLCGACPTGTVCAPTPCAGASCPPTFSCQSVTQPPVCQVAAECTGSGPGPDCPLCTGCVNGQCAPLPGAPPGASVQLCCTSAGVNCCPAGEEFDPVTSSCQPIKKCVPACAVDEFCAIVGGTPTCLKKGG